MPRMVGEWTKDKLKILEDYLPAYLSATTTAVDRIYIDAFAGPGKNVIRGSGEEIDGSPLIALNASARNGTRFTRLFFIERDEQSLAELREHASRIDRYNRSVIIPGDVNEELPKIFQRLNLRAPTFVFLDTAGIEPAWSTIERIAQWRVELLINFPLGMSINRNPDSEKTLKYFGTSDCLEILHGNRSQRTRRLLDLYKERLGTLGFRYPTEDERLIKTSSNKRLYYLMFASKVDVGKRIMEAVFGRPDAKGQSRLF